MVSLLPKLKISTISKHSSPLTFTNPQGLIPCCHEVSACHITQIIIPYNSAVHIPQMIKLSSQAGGMGVTTPVWDKWFWPSSSYIVGVCLHICIYPPYLLIPTYYQPLSGWWTRSYQPWLLLLTVVKHYSPTIDKNLTHQCPQLINLPPRPCHQELAWIHDNRFSHCMVPACGVPFGAFKRRHHCRRCYTWGQQGRLSGAGGEHGVTNGVRAA